MSQFYSRHLPARNLKFQKQFLSSHEKSTTKQKVERMRHRMQSLPDDQAEAWDSLWKEDITPWDLGSPTEALITEIKSKQQLSLTKSLIPGCGSGYDLYSLARLIDGTKTKAREHSIIGLEISLESIKRAKQVLSEKFEQSGTTETKIYLMQGDFFSPPSTWNLEYSNAEAATSAENLDKSHQQFDFIFDYLFFCALPPEIRGGWGRQMSQLLRPDGNLLTLMFPYSTTERTILPRGPPYPVSLQDYQEALSENGFQLSPDCPYASESTVEARKGQEMVGWWSLCSPTSNL